MPYLPSPTTVAGLVVFGVAILVLILWIILPFAVFNMRDSLIRLLHEAQAQNRHLAEQNQLLRDLANKN